jgi:hypothetical protein
LSVTATVGRRPGQPVADTRKAKPVKWWAVLGAICVGLIVISWSRWLLGGHAHAISPGPTPIPTWQMIALRANEVIAVLGTVVVFYLTLYRPWRRQRHLTFDGAMVIGCFSVFMLLDPALNYTQYWFSYHAGFVNLGCPQCFLPGWQSSTNFPEPILWAWGFYVMALFPAAVIMSIVMRRLKARWPQLGGFGLFMAAWGIALPLDLAVEIPWARIGAYAIGGADHRLSIFAGHYYQFPVYEAALGSLWFTVLGAFRYFRNDKGQTFAERGLEQLNTVTPAKRAGYRVLAVIGACNALTLAYYVPAYWLAIHSDAWPADITSRSYYTHICGDGTDQACPGPQIPIPVGPRSARIAPDGGLLTPGGLPAPVPRTTR